MLFAVLTHKFLPRPKELCVMIHSQTAGVDLTRTLLRNLRFSLSSRDFLAAPMAPFMLNKKACTSCLYTFSACIAVFHKSRFVLCYSVVFGCFVSLQVFCGAWAVAACVHDVPSKGVYYNDELVASIVEGAGEQAECDVCVCISHGYCLVVICLLQTSLIQSFATLQVVVDSYSGGIISVKLECEPTQLDVSAADTFAASHAEYFSQFAAPQAIIPSSMLWWLPIDKARLSFGVSAPPPPPPPPPPPAPTLFPSGAAIPDKSPHPVLHTAMLQSTNAS